MVAIHGVFLTKSDARITSRDRIVSRMSVRSFVADLVEAEAVMRSDAGSGAALHGAGDVRYLPFVCRDRGGIETRGTR